MIPMYRCAHATIFVTGLVFIASCTRMPIPEDPCVYLATFQTPDMHIVTAERVSTDVETTAHCKLTGVIETEINFELLLPDDWNGRFVMRGNAGFAGRMQGTWQGGLARGYASAGTDTGHIGGNIDASWALNNRERQENFGHRAVHLTAVTAKSIIGRYYGQAPDYSYFGGCSRAGGQAMMESQRYPSDFDGVVAGAPAYHWTGFAAQFIQNQQALYPNGDFYKPVITPDNLELLATRSLAVCDVQDGVEDGIMTDPRRCNFRVDDLPACAFDSPAADCVTSAQRAAIKTIYAGPSSKGEQIYPGFSFGSENEPGGWIGWIVSFDQDAIAKNGIPNAQFGFGAEVFKYFIFNNPEWDYTQYDFSNWTNDSAETAAILNATDTDLSAFRDRGGKIIFWTGWSDPGIAPLGTIDYYEKLASGDPAVRDYARLFMLPGVHHCSGGPGPRNVDWIAAIRAWVEDGQAPKRLIATKFDQDRNPTMKRPVCPYPEVAVYDGEGDPNDEASFICGLP